jgi:hypothetical protein
VSRFIKKRNEIKKCCYAGCKSEVTGQISLDIDLPSFNYCKGHRENVRNAVMWAILGEMKLSNAELGLNDKKTKNTNIGIKRTKPTGRTGRKN